MTPKSDVDLLVVKNVEDLSALRVATLGALSSGHPPVDVVPATLSLLERYSESLSWVYRPAVVEGLVAYERDRVVQFGSRHARDLVVRAPETEAARLVPRDHGLLELAEAVRQTGKRLPAVVTGDKLAQLTAYSGPAQYPGWSGETTAADLRDFSQIANAIHDHVDRRIADILQERESIRHERRLYLGATIRVTRPTLVSPAYRLSCLSMTQ